MQHYTSLPLITKRSDLSLKIITSLAKVIWEQGRVAAGCGRPLRPGVHSWTCMLRRQVCCVGRSFRRTIFNFLPMSHKTQIWSWNWIYRQKAHESSFPMICLPNGNVVKFSHTNRKHFTVGDAMAFPIVKMGNKNPQNLPFLLNDVDPHLIQQCLGPPHAPPQTTAPTVEALSHTYAA